MIAEIAETKARNAASVMENIVLETEETHWLPPQIEGKGEVGDTAAPLSHAMHTTSPTEWIQFQIKMVRAPGRLVSSRI